MGLPYDRLRAVAAETDVLINISGMLADPALTEPIPVRVYLDLDPGFNQLWHAAEGLDVGLDGHTHFVTIGLALGEAACDIPTCGRTWIATRQPVVLSEWPRAERADARRLHDGRELAGVRLHHLQERLLRAKGARVARAHVAA